MDRQTQQSTALRRLADARGKYRIIAIDHREVYRATMWSQAGEQITHAHMLSTKQVLIDALHDRASAILVGHDCAELVAPQQTGWIIGLEGEDYSVEGFDAANYLAPGMCPRQVKERGGDCAKLFLYCDPLSDKMKEQVALVRDISEACQAQGMPFLLEPIVLPSVAVSFQERLNATLLMLEKFIGLGITLYKLAFPGEIEVLPEAVNIAACRQLTDFLDAPWILLSSGVTEQAFAEQLRIACAGGAQGYAIGRTLWKDYVSAAPDQRAACIVQMRAMLDALNSQLAVPPA